MERPLSTYLLAPIVPFACPDLGGPGPCKRPEREVSLPFYGCPPNVDNVGFGRHFFAKPRVGKIEHSVRSLLCDLTGDLRKGFGWCDADRCWDSRQPRGIWAGRNYCITNAVGNSPVVGGRDYNAHEFSGLVVWEAFYFLVK